jgi:Tfp pilus assembly protein PilF
MKLAYVLLLYSISVLAGAQHLTYAEWKEEAKTNIRLLPKYGNAEKTSDQRQADAEFIEASVKQNGTRENASREMVRLGFKYLYQGDLRTAMYRFNQAWLLDPKNEDAFWGFGGVYFYFGDVAMAHVQYDEGLTINPKSSNLLTDKATLHMLSYNQNNKASDLKTAIQLFEKSYAIDPKNENTLFKLSVAYFLKSDCSNAKRYYTECKEIKCKSITQEYESSLTEKCK